MSTAMRTLGLFNSSQVPTLKSLRVTMMKLLLNKGSEKSMDLPALRRWVQSEGMSILLAWRSSTELPQVDSTFQVVAPKSFAKSRAMTIQKPLHSPN